MLYRVYVIQNTKGRLYTGISEDVTKRLEDHNLGISKWTKNKGLWNLLWKSEAMSLSDARKLENHLKRQKGGNGFFKITGLSKPSAS